MLSQKLSKPRPSLGRVAKTRQSSREGYLDNFGVNSLAQFCWGGCVWRKFWICTYPSCLIETPCHLSLMHAPLHVALRVKAWLNTSTFCINPTSTITMFWTCVTPTIYSNSSKDNPMKFDFPRSSTRWVCHFWLPSSYLGGFDGSILLHIMSAFRYRYVILNWNRPGRIGSVLHQSNPHPFFVVEDMLQGSEDPTCYISKESGVGGSAKLSRFLR